ncbi:MAG: ribosome maturation factor RimP [Gemmatimonadota bacterium]|nr:ribosome maturation factor RimP [Gemmatimonadota bacterium]
MHPDPAIDKELERRVEELGFEVVEIRWAGSKRRPMLQLRIDRLDAEPNAGVTIDECAAVSRGLEEWLDGYAGLPERYVLEVSSPGVDRPLGRLRDYERFSGRKVAVKGRGTLAGRARRLEGELLGPVLDEEDGEFRAIRLRLPGGDEVEIPREEIAGANLVFTWK